MKTCTRCTRNKPLKAFAKKRGGRQAFCRTCQKTYFAAYYQKRKKQIRVAVKVHRAQRLAEALQVIAPLKAAPCVDCGFTFPSYCMDFDHLDGARKVLDISNMVRLGYSMEKIMVELRKCEVVCANCHRVRTHERSIGVSTTGGAGAFEAQG